MSVRTYVSTPASPSCYHRDSASLTVRLSQQPDSSYSLHIRITVPCSAAMLYYMKYYIVIYVHRTASKDCCSKLVKTYIMWVCTYVCHAATVRASLVLTMLCTRVLPGWLRLGYIGTIYNCFFSFGLVYIQFGKVKLCCTVMMTGLVRKDNTMWCM